MKLAILGLKMDGFFVIQKKIFKKTKIKIFQGFSLVQQFCKSQSSFLTSYYKAGQVILKYDNFYFCVVQCYDYYY